MEEKHQKELKANKDTEIAEEFRKEFRRDIWRNKSKTVD